LGELVRRSGIPKAAFDGLCVSSFTLGPDTGVTFVQHVGLSPRWLDHIPMGGNSGVAALRRAARAVQAGDAEVVACIAGDTNHVDSFRQGLAGFSQFARDAVYPYGTGGPNASFAWLTAHYMRTFGATAEDFGKLCVAQRENARSFPHALLRRPMTMADYLSSRMIADPVRMFDCVMPCAGGEAVLVTTAETAAQYGLKAVRLLATIERHNAFPEDPVQFRGGWAMDRDDLWAQAGLGPEDVDLLQTYDDYPVINLLQIEDLGFCAKGEGGRFVADGGLISGVGKLPWNTDGGGLCNNHPMNRGGITKAIEAVRQLRGEAHPAVQVKDCRLALAAGPGQVLGPGHAHATVILER
jgi:acetyl-CoA acetyltransferase